MFAKASILIQQLNELITEIESQENDKLNRLKKQLYVVENAIAALEMNGLPVPSDLKETRERLNGAIVGQDEAPVVLTFLGDELRKIAEKVKKAGNSKGSARQVQTKALKTTRADGKVSVSRALLREDLIATLKDLGGSASKKQVESELEKRLRGKLTDADYEIVGVGIERWKENVQWMRYRLVQEGVMKNNSPRGIWELR